MQRKTTRLAKLTNVIKRVKEHVRDGRIIDTRHSKERQRERYVTFSEIMQVLEAGWHEKIKDEWKISSMELLYKRENIRWRGTSSSGFL